MVRSRGAAPVGANDRLDEGAVEEDPWRIIR